MHIYYIYIYIILCSFIPVNLNTPLNQHDDIIDKSTMFGDKFKYAFCAEFPNGDGRYNLIKYFNCISLPINICHIILLILVYIYFITFQYVLF